MTNLTEQGPGNGRVVLVSGASRGIGLNIARTLLQQGWKVSAGSRKPIAELSDADPAQFHWSAYDAFDPASEAQWVKDAARNFGRVDALVLNAGIVSRSSVVDASSQEFDDVFQVNVKSPMRLAQLAWPHLKAAGEGKIVVMASLAGKRVRAADGGLYSMSKAAVLMLAHGLRHAGEPHNIRSTAICPGFVATDMAAGVGDDIQDKLTRPEDIARIVATVLSLPSTASVAEVPVSWRVEPMF